MPIYNDDVYDIAPYRLAQWLTPKPNRKSGFIVFMKFLLSPLFFVHDQFVRYRNAKLYQLLITTQVAWLERLLNDKYDFSGRGIYITDAEWHLPWFLYTDDELKPQWLYAESEDSPVWLYTDAEAGDVKDDFVVYVPATLDLNENEMRSYLNQYKLFGTRYKIERV